MSSPLAAGTTAFAALIWWVVPITGLLGGIAYVVWISRFKRKFEQETFRSVGAFNRFQDSFRDSAEREKAQKENLAPREEPLNP